MKRRLRASAEGLIPTVGFRKVYSNVICIYLHLHIISIFPLFCIDFNEDSVVLPASGVGMIL